MGVEFNIRDFVDVTITKRAASRKLTYNTVIYTGRTIEDGMVDGAYYANVSIAASGDGSTKENAISYLKLSDTSYFYPWADLFFRNGGKYIHVVSNMNLNENGAWEAKLTGGNKDIPLDELVVINFASSIGEDFGGEGINQKIWLIGEAYPGWSGGEGVAQFVLGTSFTTANIASATLAAYFTNINLDSTDSIKDCMFTKINCTDDEYNEYNTKMSGTVDKTKTITAGYLAGAYRLLGGNDRLGNDLVNVWAKIVLTQVLTNDLLTLLTSKIRLDSTGVASVKTCCSKVLKKFVDNGYINTEKAWTEADLYIDDELVAAENTPLVDGYKIHVGPITQTNITNHQLPSVYILYGDQVGVRKIVVTGEVF